MDISTGKYKSDANRRSPFSAILHTAVGIARWLIGCFTLTEEDRLKAGIYGRRGA